MNYIYIYIYMCVSKVGDRSRGRPEGCLLINYYTEMYGRVLLLYIKKLLEFQHGSFGAGKEVHLAHKRFYLRNVYSFHKYTHTRIHTYVCQPCRLGLWNTQIPPLQVIRPTNQPTSVLYMTLTNLMIRLQSSSFREYGVPIHCHCFQVYSITKW